MTSRERLVVAARGGEVDQRPVICWPVACGHSDAIMGDVGGSSAISLAPVLNPFGRALKENVAIDDLLAEDPANGGAVLDGLVTRTKQEIEGHFAAGADGVLYLLYGARGLHTSPMEYGGHYLERDREILSGISDATFNMLFVVGEEDAYLDFVSDLPAHVFGWDCGASGTSVADMRRLRNGALATNSPDADIEMRFGMDGVSAALELQLQETNAAANL